MLSHRPRHRRQNDEEGTKTSIPSRRPEKRQRRQHRTAQSLRFVQCALSFCCIVILVLFFNSNILSVDFSLQSKSLSTKHKDGGSILIIGGTDGSGTRAFCQELERIGVTLLLDDQETRDIQATQLFQRKGWPGFVRYVLNQTKGTLNYQWKDFSDDAKIILKHEVGHFYKYLKRKYEGTQQRQRITNLRAKKENNILFAIKAPATMLVLPVLKHIFPKPVKFLHVLRDGRDVSLSTNQSPVQKFYNVTYPQDYKERSEKWHGMMYNVRAMQLWNDWNLQVYLNNKNNSTNYMMVRSEDLLNRRWQVLQGLHTFVESTLSPKMLCCHSQQRPEDLGKSARFDNVKRRLTLLQKKQKIDTPTVEQRYGKWKTLLKDQTLLSKHLHEEGKEALQLFGYEPFQEEKLSYPSLGFDCNEKILSSCKR